MEFVDIIIEYLPIFMFLAMGILLFIGYPVGFILEVCCNFWFDRLRF